MWENFVAKMAPIDLPDTGLPQYFNLWNMQYLQSLRKCKRQSARCTWCVPLYRWQTSTRRGAPHHYHLNKSKLNHHTPIRMAKTKKVTEPNVHKYMVKLVIHTLWVEHIEVSLAVSLKTRHATTVHPCNWILRHFLREMKSYVYNNNNKPQQKNPVHDCLFQL